MNMRWTVILLLLWISLPLPGKAASQAVAISQTVTVAGLKIQLNDLLLTPKQKILYVLWDAFPYQKALAQRGGDAALKEIASALIKNYALKKHPKFRHIKLTVVAYPSRDSYGAPRYDLAKILARFEAFVDDKQVLTIKALKLDL